MPPSSPVYGRQDTVLPWEAPVFSNPAVTAVVDGRLRTHSRLHSLSIFAIFFGVVILLQISLGAFAVESGLYSDDAAHLMNGLVIRDYLRHGLGTNPFAFAEQYYLNYPKIAPLMWPPFFHVVLGLSLLAGLPAHATGLFLVGLSATWVAWRLYHLVGQVAGPVAAVLAAGMFLTTPMVLSMTTVVMLDVVIAAMSFEAAVWLARYFSTKSSRHAALYGVFTALACITKGNGVAVVLLPVILMAITGRFDFMRRRGLYLAAGIVLVFGAPLLAMSARYDAQIGDFGPVLLSDVIARATFYGKQIWTNVGALSIALAAVGASAIAFGARRRAESAEPLAESMLALVIAGLLFHLLNPHIVSVSRYITMIYAPICGLATIGALVVSRSLAGDTGRRVIVGIVAVLMVLGAVIVRPVLSPREPLGYRHIITSLTRENALAGRRLLVVSDEVGEGAAVTEAAALGLDPAPMMIRGSKLIATDTWVGRDFRMQYATSQALMQDLEDLHVDYVLLDRSEQASALRYFEQVRALTDGEDGHLQRLLTTAPSTLGSTPRRLDLYRVTRRTPGPPKPLRINLANTIGRTLER